VAKRKIKLPDEVLEYFKREGRKGGKLSGAARMEKLTPEQRSEVARKAGAASAKVRSEKAKERRSS
jgi:general stress protein YciG